MKSTIALMACAAALLGLHAPAAEAGGPYGGVVVTPGLYGQWNGGGHRHWRGGVGVGITLGAPLVYGPYSAYPGYYGYSGYPGYYGAPLVYAEPVPAVPPMARPEPTVTARNGQSAAQRESDRRECDRWAIGQPAAMADAEVFHRATLACMDGRGYTVR